MKTKDLIYISVSTAILVMCAWVTVPSVVPFTLQTLGVFTISGLLGGKRATLSIALYILLGAVGIPVFSGFTGGVGILLGPTGGYIIGFLFCSLTIWIFSSAFRCNTCVLALSMTIGMVLCYLCGSLWFMLVYSSKGGITFIAVLLKCVVPFVIPDTAKGIVAILIIRRLKPVLKL